jgi:hypothetical protein
MDRQVVVRIAAGFAGEAPEDPDLTEITEPSPPGGAEILKMLEKAIEAGIETEVLSDIKNMAMAEITRQTSTVGWAKSMERPATHFRREESRRVEVRTAGFAP